MNASTIGGIVRTVLAALSGYLLGKGVDISGVATPEVTNAIGVVIVGAWSIWAKRKESAAPIPLSKE